MRSLVGAQLAVPAFILVWSSGYVVARLAASDAEPLSFLVLRYLFVSLLMGVLAWVARVPWPRGKELRHVIIVGVLLQATYLGGVWVAIRQGMPAGLAALIVNLQPVLTACLAAWAGESISRRQILGVILGFAGVIVVLWNKLVDATSAAYGPILLCLLALLGATLAVIYQKKHVSQLDLRSTQAVQFAASLLATLPFVMIFESFNIRWTAEVIAAMLWSVFILSGVGMSLMLYLIRTGSVTRLTSSMYLVPGVTAVMAWLMFDERLSWNLVAGMAITLVGLYLVVRGPARP